MKLHKPSGDPCCTLDTKQTSGAFCCVVNALQSPGLFSLRQRYSLASTDKPQHRQGVH